MPAPLILQHFKQDLASLRSLLLLPRFLSGFILLKEWFVRCEGGEWWTCTLPRPFGYILHIQCVPFIYFIGLVKTCFPSLNIIENRRIHCFCLVAFTLGITCFHDADIVLNLVESWEVYLQSFQVTQVPEKQHKMNSSWSLREDDGTSIFPI